MKYEISNKIFVQRAEEIIYNMPDGEVWTMSTYKTSRTVLNVGTQD